MIMPENMDKKDLSSSAGDAADGDAENNAPVEGTADMAASQDQLATGKNPPENHDPKDGTGQDKPQDGPEIPARAAEKNLAEKEEKEEDECAMGLMDHLGELRMRLVRSAIAVAIAFGVCWYYVDPLFNVLVEPLLAVLPEGTHAQYTTLPEAFFTRMLIAFVASLFLASPVIFYQIWAFVSPGLYDEEKRYIIPIALLSAIFFTSGAAFCYFIVFPYAFNFFISFSSPDIVLTPKISDYLSFVLKLLFAFGIIFEMPIFTLFLARLGIITAKLMRKCRKYAIVIIFILAAILTPPDVVSQLLMAAPMLLLYEFSIGIAAIFGRKPQKTEEPAQEDSSQKEEEA